MPYFSHHIFCCENQREPNHVRGCCADKNAKELREYLKEKTKELGLSGAGKIRINSAGCLDRCELGPVIVVYPEAIWYRPTNKADINEIISQHLVGGKVVSRLQLFDTQKKLT